VGCAGTLNDLFRFDPAFPSWTNLSHDRAAGAPPPPRYSAGFALGGGRLYLFGGQTLSGGASESSDRNSGREWGRELEREWVNSYTL
jgi:hypothetical protein